MPKVVIIAKIGIASFAKRGGRNKLKKGTGSLILF
jgi:hypothetical protein